MRTRLHYLTAENIQLTRMADEHHRPTPTRQLAPPGFIARNDGRRTPTSIPLVRVIFGGILEGGYRQR